MRRCNNMSGACHSQSSNQIALQSSLAHRPNATASKSCSSPRAIPSTSAPPPAPWPTSASPTSPSSLPTRPTGAKPNPPSARPTCSQTAREFPTLAEALADCTFVVGTGTLTHRKPEQPVVSLPALAPTLLHELAREESTALASPSTVPGPPSTVPGSPSTVAGSRIALVFGPEKHGLTRDDLAFCHALVEIPTDPRQPSMNLGQAVAVCLYELSTRLARPHGPTPVQTDAPPLQPASTNLLPSSKRSCTRPTILRSICSAANRHDTAYFFAASPSTSATPGAPSASSDASSGG